MDEIVLLSGQERAELFQETAAQKSISSAIAMEKDFWVCWILRRMFDPPLIEGMVFKGGTSLSKVYTAIDRFSEDVDLSIPRQALGFTGKHDIQPEISRSQRDELLSDMREACEARVSGQIRADLTQRVEEAFTNSHNYGSWSIRIAEDDSGTLLFAYPPSLTTGTYGAGPYIRPVIRLEFGARNEVWPAEVHTVRPYCLEEFPSLSQSPSCQVTVLSAERTFWEKATLIHAEFHRPVTSPRPERVSRHYSDLARLARSAIGQSAIKQLDLLKAVADHKAAYFPSKRARYSDAVVGQLHLTPHPQLESGLRSDYLAMREMFFSEPESFDEILATLKELELQVNELMKQ